VNATFHPRVPPAVWVVAAGAVLLLPGLGASALWEPWERDAAAAVTRFAGEGAGAGALRAPLAVAALLTVLAVFWAGAGLHGTRAALLGAGALVGMPLFVLQGRQLASEMPLVLALALSFGGLGRFAFARERRTPWRDLAVGLAGLALGQWVGGTLVGVLVPGLALACAVLVTSGRALLPGHGRGARIACAGLAAGVGVLALGGLLRTYTADLPSSFLGGVVRSGPSAVTFEHLVRQAGFGLFPWSAAAAFALCRPALDDGAPGAGDRRGGADLFTLLFAAFALAFGTLRLQLVGAGSFAALAPVAVAIGVWLDGADRRRERIVALLVAAGTLLVARDLRFAPEEMVSAHLSGPVRWPGGLSAGWLPIATGGLFTAALVATLAFGRRAGVWTGLATAALSSAFVAHHLVPQLGRHLSPQPMLDAHRRSARPGEALARFRAVAPGVPELATEQAVVDFLRPAIRRFVLSGADQIAPLHAAAGRAGLRLAALDASSRFVLLTNRLAPGEQDRHPLRHGVFVPRAPADPPPWPPPRVTRATVFAGAVELYGADFPSRVRRPGTLSLTLHFRVRQPPPPGHGIFVHLQLPGQPLLNGDHQPLGGALPTVYWVPGTLVRDQHEIDLPLVTARAGTYQLFVGLWPGGNRPGVAITAGESDGHNRCPLGEVQVE
jgi:hypothetical protein